MNKNDVKTKCKYKRLISFFWGSSKYERNGSRAKLTWHPSGVTYFARDPLCSYVYEPHKNEIYFLISHWNGGPEGWDFPVDTEHQWSILFNTTTEYNFTKDSSLFEHWSGRGKLKKKKKSAKSNNFGTKMFLSF